MRKGALTAQAGHSLYGVAYALKMSYKTDYVIPNFQQYVNAPLEGPGGKKTSFKGKSTIVTRLIFIGTP